MIKRTLNSFLVFFIRRWNRMVRKRAEKKARMPIDKPVFMMVIDGKTLIRKPSSEVEMDHDAELAEKT